MNTVDNVLQIVGSIKSSVADQLHFSVDPDPDPRIRASD
jgi:hypothetical protein